MPVPFHPLREVPLLRLRFKLGHVDALLNLQIIFAVLRSHDLSDQVILQAVLSVSAVLGHAEIQMRGNIWR